VVAAFAWVIPLAGGLVAIHRSSNQHRDPLEIAGAAGYFTTTGPAGHPLPVGRPWGVTCEPLIFSLGAGVPQSVSIALAQVIDEAEQAGLPVTLEDDRSRGYASVTKPSDPISHGTPRVSIFGDMSPPPVTDQGLEHFRFVWDAKVDPDQLHEDLTEVQAVLHLAYYNDDPFRERRSMRRILAFAEGIASTSASDSGLGRGTRRDSLSPDDVQALQLMSGCAAR
jgi:hypothetical protein